MNKKIDMTIMDKLDLVSFLNDVFEIWNKSWIEPKEGEELGDFKEKGER